MSEGRRVESSVMRRRGTDPSLLDVCLDRISYCDIVVWTVILVIFLCFSCWLGLKFATEEPVIRTVRFRREVEDGQPDQLMLASLRLRRVNRSVESEVEDQVPLPGDGAGGDQVQGSLHLVLVDDTQEEATEDHTHQESHRSNDTFDHLGIVVVDLDEQYEDDSVNGDQLDEQDDAVKQTGDKIDPVSGRPNQTSFSLEYTKVHVNTTTITKVVTEENDATESIKDISATMTSISETFKSTATTAATSETVLNSVSITDVELTVKTTTEEAVDSESPSILDETTGAPLSSSLQVVESTTALRDQEIFTEAVLIQSTEQETMFTTITTEAHDDPTNLTTIYMDTTFTSTANTTTLRTATSPPSTSTTITTTTTTTTQRPWCSTPYCRYISSLAIKPQKGCIDPKAIKCRKRSEKEKKEWLSLLVKKTLAESSKGNLTNAMEFYKSCVSWDGGNAARRAGHLLLDLGFNSFRDKTWTKSLKPLLRAVIEKVPGLHPFGQLRTEFKNGKLRKFLAPVQLSPDHSSEEAIAKAFRQVFTEMKRISSIGKAQEKKVNLPETHPTNDSLVSGCRCFCNKQLSEICEAFDVTDHKDQTVSRGKAIPVKLIAPNLPDNETSSQASNANKSEISPDLVDKSTSSFTESPSTPSLIPLSTLLPETVLTTVKSSTIIPTADSLSSSSASTDEEVSTTPISPASVTLSTKQVDTATNTKYTNEMKKETSSAVHQFHVDMTDSHVQTTTESFGSAAITNAAPFDQVTRPMDRPEETTVSNKQAQEIYIVDDHREGTTQEAEVSIGPTTTEEQILDDETYKFARNFEPDGFLSLRAKTGFVSSQKIVLKEQFSTGMFEENQSSFQSIQENIQDIKLTTESDITLIFPEITYKTVHAYPRDRAVRSITNHIPMLSEEQTNQKKELENLRELAAKVIEVGDKIKQISAEPDNDHAGDDVVGPWLSTMMWYLDSGANPYRTSRFSDRLEELLDSVPSENLVYYLMWKLIGGLRETLPGFLGPQRRELKCALNVQKYFPEFLPKVLMSESLVLNLGKSDVSISDKSSEEQLLASLNKHIKEIQGESEQNLELRDKDFFSQNIALLGLKSSEPNHFISRFFMDTLPDAILLESRAYQRYLEHRLQQSYLLRFTAGSKLDDQLEQSLNYTRKAFQNEDSGGKLNIENFGLLSDIEQFAISHMAVHCSPPNFYKTFDFTCPQDDD